jgi:hypothetical protein
MNNLQPSGAIYGFHNHAVWHGNPFRWGDFTANHSTFTSLLLPVLARLDAQGTDGAGELLDAAISFQMNSRQPNGQFEHIGFQAARHLFKCLCAYYLSHLDVTGRRIS